MKKGLVLLSFAALLGGCSLLPQTVSGTYKGTLPCADCEKIDAELVLKSDNTYQYNTVYHKNSQTYPFSDKGAFTWDQSQRSLIHLDQNAGNISLMVSDNYVELTQANGQKVSTQLNYKLQKVSQ